LCKFHVADFDTFEPANINRQFGATVPSFGRPKLDVMIEQALNINPYVEIKPFPEGITPANMDRFLDGVQVVVDALDFFEFDIRRLLFNRAREKGIYVITAGPMGFSSAMLIFSPHEGMGFDEYFNISDDMSSSDRYLSYALGLAPRATHIKYMDLSRVDLESKAGPSLNIACQVCSGMAATETVRILLGKKGLKAVPHFFQFDPLVQKYRKGTLFLGNCNPIQRAKLKIVKYLLNKKKPTFGSFPPELPQGVISSGDVPEDIIRHIILAGIQAPSGDNAQPWRFSYEGNTIFVYLDRRADDSFFNVRQLASVISCGAVLENMMVAAGAFGLETAIEHLPFADQPDLMASVKLMKADVNPHVAMDVIWKRHTNRKFFSRTSLPAHVFDDLKKAISDLAGVNVFFVTPGPGMRQLARIVYKVDRIRTENRLLHEYLISMIRFTHEQAVAKKDGFPLGNLEAGMAGEMFLRMTRPWWAMALANKIGMGRMVALHSYQGIMNASAVALVTVHGMGTKDFLLGGQALERIWLNLTQKGLSVQPMTAITLFRLRWLLEGEKDFSESHRKLLGKVWDAYEALFPEVDLSKAGQVMLFRFGFGKDITCRTLRKNLESFLV
jgi:molybdopterin/thiamine biosynthesis adenylyltransferase